MTEEAGTVKIGCRLAQGYLLRWRGNKIMLQGSDGIERSGEPGFQTQADLGIGIITPQGYGVTDVDAGFWFGWLSENDGRSEVKNRMVFQIT